MPADQDFHHWLRSGIVLCTLINKIKPGTIKKYVVCSAAIGSLVYALHLQLQL
jgi:hypothetical protein